MSRAAVALGLLSLLAFGAEPALADDFLVDDDRVQCPTAQFTSIQQAIDAAPSGEPSVITVCAGRYGRAHVPANTPSIDLVGANAGVDDPSDASCLDPDFGDDPSVHAIVRGGAGRPAFDVDGPRVFIGGFTIRDAVDAAGIEVSTPASFFVVMKGNVIKHNTVGVRIVGRGPSTGAVVEDNCFALNNSAGTGSGTGVLADAGAGNTPLREISSNFFTGHAVAAVSFVGPASPTNVSVVDNRAVKDAPMRFTAVGALVLRNRSERSKAAGIVFEDGAYGRIDSNKIRRCKGAGISLVATGAIEVDDNNVVACRHGISIRDAGGDFKVRRNATRESQLDGITLVNADGGTLRANRTEDNVRDGLRADAASRGNLIADNMLLDNREHDCHDDSVGSGTGGTANMWNDNVGQTDTPDGICRASPRVFGIRSLI